MNPLCGVISTDARGVIAAPKEPACHRAAGEDEPPALFLFVKAGGSSLDVDAARAPELLHRLHLRTGDVHFKAAVDNALGQQQIGVARHKGAGDFPLVEGAEQLLGSDYSSVDVGKTFMHTF